VVTAMVTDPERLLAFYATGGPRKDLVTHRNVRWTASPVRCSATRVDHHMLCECRP
jgi:hypothetical protein